MSKKKLDPRAVEEALEGYRAQLAALRPAPKPFDSNDIAYTNGRAAAALQAALAAGAPVVATRRVKRAPGGSDYAEAGELIPAELAGHLSSRDVMPLEAWEKMQLFYRARAYLEDTIKPLELAALRHGQADLQRARDVLAIAEQRLEQAQRELATVEGRANQTLEELARALASSPLELEIV